MLSALTSEFKSCTLNALKSNETNPWFFLKAIKWWEPSELMFLKNSSRPLCMFYVATVVLLLFSFMLLVSFMLFSC